MSVRFKFKNDLDFSSVPVDGFHISVRDLKRAIIAKKRLGRVTDFDLDVINQQNERPYDTEEALISKNSTLVVVRRPLPPGSHKTWEEDKAAAIPGGGGNAPGGGSASGATSGAPGPSGSSGSAGKSSSALSFVSGDSEEMSEEDKIKQMMTNSTEMYDQKYYVRYRGKQLHGSRPPPHYTCMKCNQPGHWASDCPLARAGYNGAELKKTTGIPRSFLKPADKNTPGAKINPQGRVVKLDVVLFARFEKSFAARPLFNASIFSTFPSPFPSRKIVRTSKDSNGTNFNYSRFIILKSREKKLIALCIHQVVYGTSRVKYNISKCE